ncbi:hypothetical protein TNCV_4858011 [Trichonephila clavipes]|nr:hypothetical protein TNCV_4858011 [Trichonephila clavipes]
MDPYYFCCCRSRLHPFHRRQGRILLTQKSQSRHHLVFEIHRLLHRMPSIFFIASLKSWDRFDKEDIIRSWKLVSLLSVAPYRQILIATSNFGAQFPPQRKAPQL